ncbi:GSCFA domain-containing protein [Ekhidna sp.]|uniref:GSCFA domain-containing protein n=1 Tax=Ekhidna sp. TaxID=2608089 RepID=UPI003B59D3E8
MFKLNFDIPESKEKIHIKDQILLIGSCFSDEMGRKLIQSKLKALDNPFGTIYNPYSIFKLLQHKSHVDDVIESQGIYYHWDAHGSISGLSDMEVTLHFEQSVIETQTFLKKSNWLIITLGTSIIYEWNNKIVANCHKIPQSKFTKRFLNQQEIIEQFAQLHSSLSQNINIIFTISPVRHIRDGLIENNRSKAILIDAIHQIVRSYENVQYFPSYEILIDELRDYRFYDRDMIHPNSQAIDYIWNIFSETYFDKETNDFLKEWSKVKAAIDHRPFQPDSESHQKFLRSTLEKLKSLNEKVDLSVEMKQIKNQLK